MRPDRWQRIEQLLDAILDLAPDERQAFLERECPDDPALRSEVLKIAQAGEEPAPLLDQPAARAAAVIPDVADAQVPIPERVGPYRIERVIGEGGMGTVFLAHRDDGQFDQRVALKLVRRGLHLDARVVRRFREERQILAALNHPGIARLFDGGIAEDGLPYFAMEYVEGEPITKFCDRRSLGVEERLALFVRVCDALAHAHVRQIVHRDIKPSNILVTTDGHPRLLDFGIAKLLVVHEQPGSEITRRSERLLTPEYASPEQIKGEPVGIACDVYCLGVLLYELLTGQRPFRRAERTPHELERAVLEEDPTRPSEAVQREPLRRQLRGDLDAIVLTAMSKEPEQRYGGAADFAADVRRHLAGRPVAARSANPAYLVRRWVRRHRVAVQSSVAAAALTGVVVMMALRSADSPDPVLRTLRVSSPQQVTNDDGLELDPALSPDGMLVAYADGIEGSMRIFVRRRDGSRAMPVTDSLTEGDHRRPRWSPDGTQLFFQAARGIWMVPTTGGTPRLVVDPPRDTTAAHSATRSPDGAEIAWVVRDTIYARSITGGSARVVAAMSVPHSLAWSPDGRWIAAVSGNSEFVFHRLGNLGPSALYLIPARCARGTSCPPVLIAPPSSLNTSPEWLDPSRLVFVSSRGGARDLFAVRVGPDGSAPDEPVPLSAGQQMHTVSVAADGRTLAYSVFRQSTNIWSLGIPSGRPARLADAARVTSGQQTIEGLALSPDGRWLAFDANRAGQQDIYLVPSSGGEAERVVDTPDDEFHTSWSPDGEALAFHTFRDGVRRAAIVPAHGGPIRLVHPNGPVREEHTPVWMADGNGLVYWRTYPHGTELYAVRRAGDSTWSAERRLTSQGGLWPSFSADGSRMAYIAPPGYVKVMGPDLDESSSLVVHSPPAPGGTGLRVDNGVITPDGTAFIAKGEDRSGAGFWIMPVAGGPPRLLLRLDDPRRTSPRPEFASDGRRLFMLLTERDSDIWAVRLEVR